MRALIAELCEFLLGQALMGRIDVACVSLCVLPSEPEPHEAVNTCSHADHAERHGITSDISWAFRCKTMVFVINFVDKECGADTTLLDERRHDARGVAYCELHAIGSRPLAVTRRVIG